MKGRRYFLYEKISVFIYSCILLLMQVPWIVIGGTRYNVFQAYRHICSTGLTGLSEDALMSWQSQYSDSEGMLFSLVKAEMVVIILYHVVCIAYIAAILLKKCWKMNVAAILISFAIMYINFTGYAAISDNEFGDLFPVIYIAVGVLELLVSRAIEEWDEASKTEKQRREEVKEWKKERKKRLYFPGKYTRLFYRIVWKNFWYNRKDYFLFVLCGAMVSALLFSGFGIYEMLSGIHSEENFLIGQGTGQILVNALLPIGFFSIFMMMFVLIFYLKTRVQNYGMFVAMGIRKKMLHMIMAIEFGISFVCSLIMGCFAGNLLLYLFGRIIGGVLGKGVCGQVCAAGVDTYKRVILAMLVIYLIAFMGTRDVYQSIHTSTAAVQKIQKEWMPGKMLWAYTGLGAIFMVVGVYQYSLLRNYEYIVILGMFLIGMFLIVRYGGAWYLRREKRKDKYLARLLQREQLYHKSRTAAWYLAVLAGVHFCAMFYFTFQIVSVMIAETPEELYPYDFMCIADEEDETFFEELEEKYEIQIEKFPMVRISTPDKTQQKDYHFDEIHPPAQGQHIGISENTYHELKKLVDADYEKKALELDEDGKEIYVVHQQDKSIKAQPTDWYGSGKMPHLHIGQPLQLYNKWKLEEIFVPRIVTGEEIGSLTGCFRQGVLENLIVFSNEYFERAQDMWKYTNFYTGERIDEEESQLLDSMVRQGPTKLVLIRTDDADSAELEKEMEAFRERHSYDEWFDSEVLSCYTKKTAVDDLKSERMMKLMMNGFVLAVLVLASVFLLYVKTASEFAEKKNRAVFLECMGMREKERIDLLKKELYRFYRIPTGIAVLSASSFTVAAFRARMYTTEDARKYAGIAVWFWIGYLLIQWGAAWILGKVSIYKVEKQKG